MNLKDIVIKFSVSNVQRILAIEMDSDQKQTLEFIKENLSTKVKKALEPH